MLQKHYLVITMAKYLYVVILFLVSGNIHAQEKRELIDSLQYAIRKTPEKQHAALYIDIANQYRNISGDTCLFFAQKAIALAQKHKDKIMLAEGYSLIGIYYKNKCEYETSLEYQLKSLKIAEELNDGAELASTYNNIGILYKKMKRWDEALFHYNKSLGYAKQYSNEKTVALIYNNIGAIYLEKEKWDLVERNYDSARKYADLSGNTYAKATILGNIGDLYREQGKYQQALATVLECLSYDKINEDKYGMFTSYFLLSRIYNGLKDYNKYALYADSAENIARKEGLTRELLDLISWKSSRMEERGMIPEAYALFKQAKEINDSIFTEATAEQVSELQTKYETEKKEQQIALQQSELSKKNYIIIGIGGISLLGILLGVSSYRRYRLMQQGKLQKAIMREQELATEAVIAAEEKERTRIAGDLHDGVGQLMSAARMNLSIAAQELNFEDEEQRAAFDKALSLVDDSCREVRSVSHNIMPNALLKTGLASAIRDFLHKIDHRALEVNLYSDGMNERLPVNTETILYRVIQECVNNVIKHSAANTLDITLIKDEQEISVTIEDNGKGFSLSDTNENNGIGLANMRTRIHYLKGNIEWDSAPGKGTVVTITIPTSVM